MHLLYSRYFRYLMLLMIFAPSHEDNSEQAKLENKKHIDAGRRLIEQLDDEGWHIAHLKPTDFEDDVYETRRDGCKEETFEDKVKKYRKTLKLDAGRLTFVSSDPLPVDPNDFEDTCVPDEVPKKVEQSSSAVLNATSNSAVSSNISNSSNSNCSIPLNTSIPSNVTAQSNSTILSNTTIKLNSSVPLSSSKPSNSSTPHPATVNATTTSAAPTIETLFRAVESTTEHVVTDFTPTTEKNDLEFRPIDNVVKKTETTTEEILIEPISDVREVVNQVTTPKMKHKGKKKKKKERRSEYIFSSSEYEDDVTVFDPSWCPGAIEEVKLQIDILRPYDIECELSIKWKSLD